MRRSSRVILLLGIFLALGAFILILFLGGGRGPAATPTPAIAQIVRAIVDIPQGTTITESMVTTEQVPLAAAPGDSFALTASVVGRTARQSVAAGAYIPQSAITGAQAVAVDVARELKPGERAVALQVSDPNVGVGFLIQSGDRVDLIVTVQNLPVGFLFGLDPGKKTLPDVPRPDGAPQPQGPAGDTGFQVIASGNKTSAKLLIQNVRVVYAKSDVVAQPQGAEVTPEPGSQQVLAQLLVLAMTAQQAEVLSFVQTQAGAADTTAKIFLAIRAQEDAEASPDITTGVVLRTLLDEYGVLPPRLVIVENQGQ